MRIFLIALASIILLQSSDAFSKDPKGKVKYKYRLSQAKTKFIDEDYNGALRLYRELFEEHKTDANLNNMIGRCYLALKDMEKALEFFGNAEKINPSVDFDLYLYMGQASQYIGQLDKALEYYNKYVAKCKKKYQVERTTVMQNIDQCKNAKYMMENPVKAKIRNMGRVINCEFTDAAPSITADGKTFIFTSRRADTEGGGIDPNTGYYFDDIYISTWDDQKSDWTTAENLTDLNTPEHDASCSISPDGNSIFLYKNIPSVTRSGDIYISKINAAGKWGAPKPLNIIVNSSFFESSACLSPDGKTLYFVSERNGGQGNADIWMSTIDPETKDWGKPVNLGEAVNTDDDEIGVFIHPDGKTLFFTSKGHNSIGGFDVFQTVLQNGKWSKPANLGYPINTTRDEVHFVMATDGRKAFISSSKENGFGDYDIYEVDMSNYTFPIIDTTKSNIAVVNPVKIVENTNLSILRGSVVDADNGQKMENIAVVITEVASGKKVAELNTNEIGDYFITLPGDKEYQLEVTKTGYKTIVEKVTLPLGKDKVATIYKSFNLSKDPTN
ncbi:MAG: carboxypeptidase regulatory-like domain-containing protein [Bacteroidota bacterium]